MKLYEIAKLLDLPYYHVKDCLKYWMKEQNHYRPKVLRNYKSFENIDKQPNKKPSRKLKRLYKLF
jgi:hypothetical protein